MKTRLKWALIGALLLASCGSDDNGTSGDSGPEPLPTPIISYSVIKVHPHDVNSFTEGLLVHDGVLFESTGAPESLPQTRSLFGTLSLETGRIDVKGELDRNQYFGEGIAILNDKLYQLTYQTKKGFIYDANTFKKLGEFSFPSQEGWGMTTDGQSLIMSDGTATLTYLDSQTMQVTKTLQVTDSRGAVQNLNELEFIKGFIYANVYTTNDIVKIDPASGQVTGRIDLGRLAAEARAGHAGALEMNGIAYDAAKDRIYVTGKMWPALYEVQLGQ